jgi:hypothetical protein
MAETIEGGAATVATLTRGANTTEGQSRDRGMKEAI